MTMTAEAAAGDAETPDLSAVMAYMQRNNLARMKLTIEALDVDEASIEPAGNVVMVAEIPSLFDDSTPSDLGLEGVFVVVSN